MLLSKLLRQSPAVMRTMPLVSGHSTSVLVPTKRLVPMVHTPARLLFGLVPKNQYDVPLTKKLVLSYSLWVYWETLPLFLVTVFDIMFILFGTIVACFFNKVDLQWSKHNWNCISRNMDLRNPTVHKLITIYQEYEPWPEMQMVFDKMTEAEHRAMSRLASCTRP